MTVALGILSYFSEHQPEDNLVFFFFNRLKRAATAVS